MNKVSKVRFEALLEAEQMPSLMHNYERDENEPFDYRKSEMMNWLMAQPACRRVAEQMVVDLVKRDRAVVWERKDTWKGAEKVDEGALDGMHEMRRDAVMAAMDMPELKGSEMTEWLLEQDECYQFACGRLRGWLFGKWVIKPTGPMKPWQGAGAGFYENRRAKSRARKREKLKAYQAEMKKIRAEKRAVEAPRLEAEKRERIRLARIKSGAKGFKRCADEKEIKEAMCSQPPHAPRSVIFRMVQARFKVSLPTLDRYRRQLLAEGRLKDEGGGFYSPPVLGPVMEEAVYL